MCTIFTAPKLDNNWRMKEFRFEAEKEQAGDKCFKIVPISWCGKPSYDVTTKSWSWGYIEFYRGFSTTEDCVIVGSGGMLSNYETTHTIGKTDICRLVAYVIM